MFADSTGFRDIGNVSASEQFLQRGSIFCPRRQRPLQQLLLNWAEGGSRVSTGPLLFSSASQQMCV